MVKIFKVLKGCREAYKAIIAQPIHVRGRFLQRGVGSPRGL
jgi:hypothetical protein